MSRIKNLAKNTLIITVGKISTQFISFLLLPLYTALLTTEEYGTVDLITTIVQLLIPIASLMIDQGVFRFLLFCEDSSDKKKIISSAFYTLFCLNVLFLLAFVVLMPFITAKYKIWILLILFVTAYNNLFLQVARGLKRTVDYTVGSFLCSVVTIALNVLCIVFIRMRAVGMLLATLGGNSLCCIYLFFKLDIFRYISFSDADKTIAKEELRYSAPLVPNQLSLWVMNSSDRIIVSLVLGTAANGVLAVSHKFPSIFMTFFNVFLLAWHETGAVHFFDEDRDSFFSDAIDKILMIFATLCMCIIVALPLVFDSFVNISYKEAYYNIPVYLIASLFNVIVGVLGIVYVATKKTFEIAKTTMLAAAINIFVNIVLINYIGLYAASISTFISYLITMIYRIIDTKKYINIRYNYKHYVIIIIGIILCTFIYYLNNKMVSIVTLFVFSIVAFLLNKDFLGLVISALAEKVGKKQ